MALKGVGRRGRRPSVAREALVSYTPIFSPSSLIYHPPPTPAKSEVIPGSLEGRFVGGGAICLVDRHPCRPRAQLPSPVAQNRTEPIEQRHMLSDVGRLIPFVTSSQLLSCLALHPLTILSSCVLYEYYHLFKLPGVYAYTSRYRLREHRLLMYL